jgi:hypothetical protein
MVKDHSITGHQHVQFSNVSDIRMSGIRIFTVIGIVLFLLYVADLLRFSSLKLLEVI